MTADEVIIITQKETIATGGDRNFVAEYFGITKRQVDKCIEKNREVPGYPGIYLDVLVDGGNRSAALKHHAAPQSVITDQKFRYRHEQLIYTSKQVAELIGVHPHKVADRAPMYANCKLNGRWAWSKEAVSRLKEALCI